MTCAFAELVGPRGVAHGRPHLRPAPAGLGRRPPSTPGAATCETTPADAVFILGDLFEVWVGDDAAAEPGFEAQCAEVLRAAAERRPIFFMHGNRDFLVGAAFAAQCGMTLLDDPDRAGAARTSAGC